MLEHKISVLRDKSARALRKISDHLVRIADRIHPQSAKLERHRNLHTTIFRVQSASSPNVPSVPNVYFSVAANFIMSADMLLEEHAPPGPCYFLLGHGIEVLLKSYLIHHNIRSQIELKRRPFQHDLELLLDECKANGMTIPSQLEAILRFYAPYFKDFSFRYGFVRAQSGPTQQTIQMPHEERLLEVAMHILGVVVKIII